MALSRINWVTIGRDRARIHPLYGFGGWNWILLPICLGEGVLAYVFIGDDLMSRLVLALSLALSITLVLNARIFRPLFFAYAALSVAVALFDAFLGIAHTMKIPIGSGMSPSLMLTIIFVIYVHESRRINVTMCNRVKADDPFLETGAP